MKGEINLNNSLSSAHLQSSDMTRAIQDLFEIGCSAPYRSAVWRQVNLRGMILVTSLVLFDSDTIPSALTAVVVCKLRWDLARVSNHEIWIMGFAVQCKLVRC